MRTRITSAASAVLLAAAMFASSAGTALMATQSYPIGGLDNDNVLITLHFDDVTRNILDVTAINNSGVCKAGYQLFSKGLAGQPPAGTSVYGPKTVPINSGTTVFDLSGLNAKMILLTTNSKFGMITNWVAPVDYSLSGQC